MVIKHLLQELIYAKSGVSQKPGTSIQLESYGVTQSYNASAYGLYARVQFPFVARNTNYDIHIDRVDAVNLSPSLANPSIKSGSLQKTRSGFACNILGAQYVGTNASVIKYTITFR